MIPLTSSEIEHIAAASAKQAVRELLVAMGVDANDPKALLQMQADFKHLRTWRESVETVKTQSIKTAAGVIVTGILGAIYAMYFKGWPFHQ
jgi:hypothetical protein